MYFAFIFFFASIYHVFLTMTVWWCGVDKTDDPAQNLVCQVSRYRTAISVNDFYGQRHVTVTVCWQRFKVWILTSPLTFGFSKSVCRRVRLCTYILILLWPIKTRNNHMLSSHVNSSSRFDSALRCFWIVRYTIRIKLQNKTKGSLYNCIRWHLLECLEPHLLAPWQCC